MGRLWNEINENVLTEDDLISLTKWHNVSVYRKENFLKIMNLLHSNVHNIEGLRNVNIN